MAWQRLLHRLTPLLLLWALASCSTEPETPAVSARARVEEALRRLASVNVKDEPLEQVLARLADQQDLAIKLKETGPPLWIGPPPQVTLHVQDIPLASVLRHLLQPHDLTFLVQENGLFVLHQDEAETRLSTEVYLVHDILENHRGQFSEEDLEDAITTLVERSSWEKVGGSGYIRATPGALLVASTAEVHGQIARLLDDIRSVADPRQAWPQRPPPSASEQAVRQALTESTTLDCQNTPFTEVIDQLRQRHGINIVLADVELQELQDYDSPFGGLAQMGRPPRAQVGPPVIETPVTLHVANVPLESALNLLQRQFDFAWLVRDDTLLITSDDVAENLLEVRVYPTSQLNDRQWLELGNHSPRGGLGLGGSQAGVYEAPDDSLVEAIQSVFQPQIWDQVGGPCGVEPVPGGLAIAAPERAHAALSRFLTDVERAVDPFALEPFQQPIPPERQRIEALLDRTVTVNWERQPLLQALTNLAAEAGIPNLVFDIRSLEISGITPDEPVSVAVSDVSVRSVLNLALDQHYLGCIVDNGVLLITTDVPLENRLETIVYPVPHLLVDLDYNELIDLLIKFIEPQSWDHAGGPANVAPIPSGLAIAQTRKNHAQVQEFLDTLGWMVDPVHYPLPVPTESPAVRRLCEALGQPASIEALSEPLEQVLDDLAARHGIPNLNLDPHGTAFRRGESTSFIIDGVSLGTALHMLLAQAQLTWRIENEVLVVTTRERADNILFTRCYPVPLAADEPQGVDPEDLVKVIRHGIDSPWLLSIDDMGLTASVRYAGNGLVVRQTREGHAQVEKLLEELRPFLPQGSAPLPAEAADVEAWMNVAREQVLRDWSSHTYSIRALVAPDGPFQTEDLTDLVVFLDDPAPAQTNPPFAVPLGGALVIYSEHWGHDHWHRLLDVPDEAIERLADLMGAHEVEPFRAALNDEAPLVRWYAWRQLAGSPELGLPLLDAVIAGLSDRDAGVRWVAVEVLGALGPAAKRAVPGLAERLQDDDSRVRWRTAQALGEIGPAAGPAVPDLARAFEGGADELYREAFYEALRRIGAAAVPVLVEHIKSERFQRVRDASEVLADMRPVALETVPALVACLKLSSTKIPYDTLVCQRLGQMGRFASSATPAIVPLLSSRRADARVAACEALPAIGADPALAVPALVPVLADRVANVRAAACAALGQYGPAALDAIPRLREAASDRNEDVRAAAADALALIEPRPEQSSEVKDGKTNGR